MLPATPRPSQDGTLQIGSVVYDYTDPTVQGRVLEIERKETSGSMVISLALVRWFGRVLPHGKREEWKSGLFLRVSDPVTTIASIMGSADDVAAIQQL